MSVGAQLELQLYTDEVDLEGYVDKRGIRYLGKARKQSSGKWICLADVAGALCLVEISIAAPGV